MSNRLNTRMNTRKRIILETVKQILEAEGGYEAPRSKQDIASSLLAAAQQTHGEMMGAYNQIPAQHGPIGKEGEELIDAGHPQMLNSILQTFLKHHPEVQQKITRVAPMGDQGTWHAASTLIAFPDIHPIGHQIAMMHKRGKRCS